MSEMTTIKALAQDQHCSYQAIWKLVTKYEKDLGNHVVKKGRDRFLDEYAVNFILEKRKDHPMVALNVDQSAIIESQNREIEALKARIDSLQEQIKSRDNSIIEMQREQQKVIEYKLQTTHLLEDNQRLKEESDQLKEENKSLTKAGIENEFLRQKIDDQADALKLAKSELESFQPSLFGLYRKKKR